MSVSEIDKAQTAAPHVTVAASNTATEENFPVGSWLLPRHLRPHVAVYYRFARTSDDIADCPDLPAEAKLAGLNAMDVALDRGGDPNVDPIRASIAETGIGLSECRDLLVAFRRDAHNQSCDSWADLLDYCRYSAHPVGRYLLLIHGEDPSTLVPGDALCAAFQILNHLQDCGDDWRNLGRVYVPRDWIAVAGGTRRFFDPVEAALRRPVLDRCLDGVDRLLETASLLPGRLKSRGLKAEVAVMLSLAYRLAAKLRAGDPLQARVALGKRDFLAAMWPGIRVLAGLEALRHSDKELVSASVQRAGSSFAAGMRILPANRRRAMYALYGFCRAVDDIADAPIPVAEKRADLDAWQAELDRIYAGQGDTALAREMIDAVRRYDLPRAEFDLILDGMRIDAAPQVRIADRTTLSAYARRVAGAVGVLSSRIFGAGGAASTEFAIFLGETLQLTNILRDIDEDAAIDRLYLPLDRLSAAGIDVTKPVAVIVADPRLTIVCDALAAEVAAMYAAVDTKLPAAHRKSFRSALAMGLYYRKIFDKLMVRGWRQRAGGRPRLSKSEKLVTMLVALAR